MYYMHSEHSWPNNGEQIAFNIMDFHLDWVSPHVGLAVISCAAEWM